MIIDILLPAGTDHSTTRDIGRVTRASDEFVAALLFAYNLDPTKDLKIIIEYKENQ